MEFLNTDFLDDGEIRLVLKAQKQADPARNRVPAYLFYITDRQRGRVGTCDLRVGWIDPLYYSGHIGYEVDEAYRGHHYAAKACRLLFGLAKKHGMQYVLITCRPDNIASRKTCEYAGCRLVEIAELPPDHELRTESGHTHECIYRYYLT
ncbi:MAG: GNAT family N-acetyltransferase [Clostridia bacterium]|nr:GNAT family N-acetyltransferase [Clostridia bacterium]